jgi:hypothetical protein
MNTKRPQRVPGMHMDTMIEARIPLPAKAPRRVLEDIAHYNALVSLQNRMSASAPWYTRLS